MNREELQQQIQQQRKTVRMVFLGLALFFAGLASAFFLAQSSLVTGPGTEDVSSLSRPPAPVNSPAPELSLKDIQGKTGNLRDYRDKVVLVNTWATWCPPCRDEMPTLVAFYNEHVAEGFVIISIEAGESRSEVLRFVAQYNMNFPVWLDLQGEALQAFGNRTLPSSYVIDRAGTLRIMWVGEINRETLEEYVTPLIREE